MCTRRTKTSHACAPVALQDGFDDGVVVEEFGEAWEYARIEPHEFIEAGDLVVMPGTLHVKGRDGIEVVSRGAFVWTIRNGAIERMVMYQSRQDALEAVGLSEQDAHADS